MLTTYVNLKSEITASIAEWNKQGNKVYRTRLVCGCIEPQNRRTGIIVIDANHIQLAQVIRCKACKKGGSNGNN